jgi:hypothetical protein
MKILNILWRIFRLPLLIVGIFFIVALLTGDGITGFFAAGGAIIILAIIGFIKTVQAKKRIDNEKNN